MKTQKQLKIEAVGLRRHLKYYQQLKRERTRKMFSRCKTCKVRSKMSEAEQNMLQVLMFRKDVSDYQVFRTFKEHGIDVSHDSINYHREHCLEPIRKKVEETY